MSHVFMRRTLRPLLASALSLVALSSTALAKPQVSKALPRDRAFGKLEVVQRFYGASPIGVVVSKQNRIFLSFPRSADAGPYCVGELVNHRVVPYPNLAMQQTNAGPLSKRMISMQGMTLDASDRLWLLDSGRYKSIPVRPGGPKLVCIDLATNRIVQTIVFPPSIAGPKSYLNDVRVDLRKGKAGVAYITDAAEKGDNAIVVVDLASGRALRRLNNYPQMKAEKNFITVIEGRAHLVRPLGGAARSDTTGVNGIALNGDGSRLFVCPNAGRHLYSIATDKLADFSATDTQIAKTIIDHGPKPGASGGMEGDSYGRLYVTDYEHNAIMRRLKTNLYESTAHSENMIWPDSMSISSDGYLYFTCTQVNRSAKYHRGKDLREKPFILFRTKTDSQPVLLGP